MQSTVTNWTEQAKRLRDRAGALSEGAERDLLLQQADQLDQAIEMTNLLSVTVPRKYR